MEKPTKRLPPSTARTLKAERLPSMKPVRRRIVPAAVALGANAGSLQTQFQGSWGTFWSGLRSLLAAMIVFSDDGSVPPQKHLVGDSSPDTLAQRKSRKPGRVPDVAV